MSYHRVWFKHRTAITLDNGTIISIIADDYGAYCQPRAQLPSLADYDTVELAIPIGPDNTSWPCVKTILPPLLADHFDDYCEPPYILQKCNTSVAPYITHADAQEIITYLGTPVLTVHSTFYDC